MIALGMSIDLVSFEIFEKYIYLQCCNCALHVCW